MVFALKALAQNLKVIETNFIKKDCLNLKCKGFNAVCLNVRHILSKFDELKNMITINNRYLDLFGLVETFLKPDINNEQCKVPGYKIFRKDRQSKDGGGLLVYVKDSIAVKNRSDLSINTLETLWLESINEHEAKINDHTEKICRQFIWINKIDTQLKENSRILDLWDSELEALHKKAKDMDSRLESQEQYSRRTSLRFHNIQVPVDGHGKIIHPVNTDDKILSICNSQLGLNLSINDISRSHVIGKAKYGKCQVIVRFMSYRTRDMVYTNKKYLKHNEDGIFITENLTKFRTDLTKKLSQMKYNNQIHAYWTSDGRIFVKRAENSRKELINSFGDISDIERGTTASPNQQRSDTDRSPEANEVNTSQQSNNGE
ncbi:unnamed protein product [Mytilus coruscus]|uniref:Uncharacterized protein n=1 Tax=Mytilus coruscus TaxID=42192 RepID=A0A6J8E7W8_MYTCO|nr:unnamed protein product [Mytilus coruscus]